MRTPEQNRAHVLAWQKANPAKYRTRWNRWRKKNSKQLNAKTRAKRRKRTPEQKRQDQRRHTARIYGLTVAQWDALFESQGRRCAICRTAETVDGRWHTDHDAAIGKHAVRGILCVRCNIGLGQFMDDPARLLQAAAYLQPTTTEKPCSRI